jgi:hypothetical protein
MPRHTSLVIDDDRPCFAECEADWAKNEERLASLVSLAKTLYHAAANGRPLSAALARHACELLGLDMPVSEPRTEGP